jgi:hypothetical protein
MAGLAELNRKMAAIHYQPNGSVELKNCVR